MEEPQTAATSPTAEPEVTWPRVDIAYDLVERSYQVMLERLESVEGRIQALQTLIVTLTLAVPLFGRSIVQTADLTSGRFIAALVTFALALICGVVGRAWGSVTLANPKVMYEKWLHYSVWEFKKTALYWAGKHYEANSLLVNRKGYFLTAMSALFVVEVILLLLWLIEQS